MNVTDINQHLKPPPGAVCVRADVRQGWFVVTYSEEGRIVEIYFNQQGREVFRVAYKRPNLWGRILKWMEKNHATANDPPIV